MYAETGLCFSNGIAFVYSLELEGDYHSKNPARLRQRKYGQTGVKLSIIGFGGIVVDGAEQQHANRVVAEAFEKGVNYFDVSPTYDDAELKLGCFLRPP